MNSTYKKYLLSSAWAKIRVELFLSRGKKCERCSKKQRLQIHHKNYDHIFNEEPEDLEILCYRCHKEEHFPKKKKHTLTLAQKVKRKNKLEKQKRKRMMWRKR